MKVFSDWNTHFTELWHREEQKTVELLQLSWLVKVPLDIPSPLFVLKRKESMKVYSVTCLTQDGVTVQFSNGILKTISISMCQKEAQSSLSSLIRWTFLSYFNGANWICPRKNIIHQSYSTANGRNNCWSSKDILLPGVPKVNMSKSWPRHVKVPNLQSHLKGISKYLYSRISCHFFRKTGIQSCNYE